MTLPTWSLSVHRASPRHYKRTRTKHGRGNAYCESVEASQESCGSRERQSGSRRAACQATGDDIQVSSFRRSLSRVSRDGVPRQTPTRSQRPRNSLRLGGVQQGLSADRPINWRAVQPVEIWLRQWLPRVLGYRMASGKTAPRAIRQRGSV